MSMDTAASWVLVWKINIDIFKARLALFIKTNKQTNNSVGIYLNQCQKKKRKEKMDFFSHVGNIQCKLTARKCI